MAPSLGAEGALCDCSAPSNRECVYKENVVGGRPPSNDEKSLRKVPPCVYKENIIGGLQRRKVPSKNPSNDDRMAPSLGEVAPS